MDSNWNHTTIGSSTINHRLGLINENKSKKKCHGNKKLQRFRQRRRARGMSGAAIEKTIEARNGKKTNKTIKTDHSNNHKTKKQSMSYPHHMWH